MTQRILLTGLPPGGCDEWLRGQGWSVESVGSSAPADRTEVLRKIPSCAGVLALPPDRIDREFLERAPKLRAISLCAVGYDNVDLQACAEREIPVAHTPGVLTDAVADLTMALLLAVARQLIPADRFLREGRFHGWDVNLFLGSELRGKTLGLVGAGRIAREVRRRAEAFGMRVIVARRSREATAEVEVRGLDELLQESDVVSIHCPLTRETRHLIDAARISRMKKGAFLINTSRGPIVEERALVEALRKGDLSGAGLDVFEREPAVEEELLSMTNVVLLPHIGSATIETRTRMGQLAATQLDSLLRGRFAGVFLVPGSTGSPAPSV